MAKNLDDLKTTLFSTKDGGAACDAINKLTKHAKKGNAQAKQVLAEYTCNGRINHMREFACSNLAELVGEADIEFAEIFQRGLTDPNTRYWSILGLIKTSGKTAYKELVRVAQDKTIPIEERSHAVKCLATFSKQPFDRSLPSDPGEWDAADLRLSEVAAWAKAGYLDGQGFSEPIRHPALDKPKTTFEKIVSRFDKKLAKKRQKHQDPANPTNWLAIASKDDIERITTRWDLPSVYLDFLTRFSPTSVIIESRRFYNHLQLFGANELIKAQDGYSFNPVKQKPIKDWPADYVVIASHGGDPFVLDLSNSDGKDAPVLTAEHGMGEWNFDEDADSFATFLDSLAK